MMWLCIVAIVWGKEEKLTSTITWELSPVGVLSIRGTGEMPDFDERENPKYWRQKKYDGKIKVIEIGEGITSVGAVNFGSAWMKKGNEMSSVKKIIIPSSVTRIGAYAFNFTGVEEIIMGKNVRIIGSFSFANNNNLMHITLPKTVEDIRFKAFAYCRNLKSVDFSNAAASIGREAFKDDEKLSRLENAGNITFASEAGRDPAKFSTVFAGTQLNEDTYKISAKDSEATLFLVNEINNRISPSAVYEEPIDPYHKNDKQIDFPDKEWTRDWMDGGMVYGTTVFHPSFSHPDPSLSINGLSAPYGYEEYQGEGGDYIFRIFSDVRLEGNKAYYKTIDYTFDYDSAAEKETITQTGTGEYKATYNPADGSVDISHKIAGNDETYHLKNPDRQQYVIVNYGNKVNIRKIPKTGSVIGKADKGQLYKLKSKKEIETGNSVESWFEVEMPDNSTGFISGEFASIAYDEDEDPGKVGSEIFEKGIAFIESIDDPMGEEGSEPVGVREFRFEKIGERVLMIADEMYFNGRIHGCGYFFGQIADNSIIFNKGIYDQGGFAGADEAYESGDYKKLESMMCPEDEMKVYYYNGILYYFGEELEKVYREQ